MRNVFFLILTLLFSISINAVTIEIRTQKDFDNLSAEVLRAIAKGEKVIVVDIKTAKLTFHDNQITLNNINRKNVSIAIHGNGVQITSEGHFANKATNPEHMYLCNGEFYNPWTDFQEATDTIELVDITKHLCRIAAPSKYKKSSNPQNTFVHYTCWYTSRISPVISINKRSITFDGGEWAVPRSERLYNVNMDYAFSKTPPRYRLFGTKKVPKNLFECSASTLLKILQCNLRSFSIDGIHVTGSNMNSPLLVINSSRADSICVSNSSFYSIGGTLLLDRNSSNVHFKGNTVDHIMGYGVQSSYNCTGAKVTDNIFTNCGLGMTNTFAIIMNSDKFTVSGNKISDFCYGGIGVGIWGGADTIATCRGIVHNNELFYTKPFINNYKQNTLMDSGTIYVWTRTDGITISNNYIHDITGMRENRGIFCDDGTKNVTLSNNKIERIHNFYDIDLRWCDMYKARVPDHNTGNKMQNNKTTGTVRFETSPTKH